MHGLFLTTDLNFSARVSSAARVKGVAVEVVGATKKLLERAADAKVKLIILDLGAPGLNVAELLPQLKQANESAAVVAYAPHVHEDKLTAAQDAGCDEVLVRGQFNQQIDALLAKYLDE